MLDRLIMENLQINTKFTKNERIYNFTYDIYAGDSEFEFEFMTSCRGVRSFHRPCQLHKLYVDYRLRIDESIHFVIEVYEKLNFDVAPNVFRAMEILARDNDATINEIFELVQENKSAKNYINDIKKYMILI